MPECEHTCPYIAPQSRLHIRRGAYIAHHAFFPRPQILKNLEEKNPRTLIPPPPPVIAPVWGGGRGEEYIERIVHDVLSVLVSCIK